MKTPVIKIGISAAVWFCFIATGYSQSPAVQGKMETLLKRAVPDTKVTLDKTKKILAVQESSAGKAYSFKIPWMLVNNKSTYRVQNRDTFSTANIECAKGESCISISVDGQQHRTKAVMLSFATKRDADAFARLMNHLKK